MSDVSNTQNEAMPDGSTPPAESSGVLVTPEPVVLTPPAPPAPVAVPAALQDIDDGALSDEEDDDAIEVEPHEVPRHFSAPAFLPLERLDPDETFRIRPASDLDDVTALATDVARLGQLFPIDVRLVPPDRIQIITGFRRVAALRFLQREKVVARLHTELSDGDAMLMAIASAIHSRSVDGEALKAVQERLESEGRLSPPARDMLIKALAADDALSPENVEEEVDADELASDVSMRLSQCNQDLSLLADVFDQLDDEKREALLTQLRYSSDLVTFLESKK
ncbi:MAG: ParB/RepB/Spo0J family partition protein [Myxococcales bacterium]|nr:ParB/RepB/Spo0J family partition protein [Myxococcales bacterium]